MRKTLFFGAKIILAGLLLWPLLAEGKIDWAKLGWFLQSPWFGLGVLIFFATNHLISALRFFWLLPPRYAGFPKVLACTFLGNFFNNFLPGLISGDFLKVFYLQKSLGRRFSWQILQRALIDRGLGISGLVFLGLISSFWIDQPSLQTPILLLSLFLAGFWCVLIFRLKLQAFLNRIQLPFLRKLQPRIDSWQASLNDLSLQSLSYGFFLSLLIFVLQTLVLFFYTRALGSSLDWSEVIAASSLGLIASALPITPLGIGLGHLAFQGLFQSLGFSAGADLYNLFLATQLVANLPGLAVFLFPPKGAKPL